MSISSSEFSPFVVTVIGFDGAFASAITGALDMFSLAGVSWQRFNGQPIEPRFTTQVASIDGQPISCTNRIVLQVDIAIEQVTATDILLIPTIGGELDTTLQRAQSLLPHINRLATGQCDVVSNCSGAFLLAQAGVLDGRSATTHWGYANLFRQRYPQVKLNEKRLITQDDNVYCAGGGVSFQDMCLMLIERYCGRDISNQVAKAHVINRQSGFQSTYANFHRYKTHRQGSLLKVQEHIEANYAAVLSINALAGLINVTERTLHRQFKKYVGMTPSQYVQSVRIENAKRLLEQGGISVKQLPAAVGYEDVPSFSRLFKQKTGFTPTGYLSRFHRQYG